MCKRDGYQSFRYLPQCHKADLGILHGYKFWISAASVPGIKNTAADEESRKENLDTEWKLNPDILVGIKPEVDVFASRINAVS